MGNTLGADGGRIRDLRIRRGWTQEHLAEVAGVSPRTVQRMETGGRSSFESLRALAGAFELDVHELMKEREAATPTPAARPITGVPDLRCSLPETSESVPGLPAPRLLAPQRGPRLWSHAPEASVLALIALAFLSSVAVVGRWWAAPYAPSPASAGSFVSLPLAATSVEAARRSPPATGALPLPRAHLPAPKVAFRAPLVRRAPQVSGAPVIEKLPASAAGMLAPVVQSLSAPLEVVERPDWPMAVPQHARAGPDLDAPAGSPTTQDSGGVMRQAWRAAGRKTGAFFSRATSSIGTTMRTVF